MRRPPPASASKPRRRSRRCRCSSGPARSFPWGRSFSIPARSRPIRLNCAFTAARTASSRSTKIEGDTYNYEKGEYATIPISWNEGKHTLEIGERSGRVSRHVEGTHVQRRLGFGKSRRGSLHHGKAGCRRSLHWQGCDGLRAAITQGHGQSDQRWPDVAAELGPWKVESNRIGLTCEEIND